MLLFLLGCTYTVRSLAQVSPGGGPGEFYAIVRTEHWESGALTSTDATVIRCTTSTVMDMDRYTACQRVLTSDEAFRATERDVPIVFGSKKGDK